MVMTEVQNLIKINKHAIKKIVQHNHLKRITLLEKSLQKLQTPDITLFNKCT